MAHRVVWSERALADVDAIAAYIAVDSSSYARTVVKRILTSTKNLSSFPMLGRQLPEGEDENLCEVFAYSYGIIHRVESDLVTVIAVIHGKRVL